MILILPSSDSLFLSSICYPFLFMEMLRDTCVVRVRGLIGGSSETVLIAGGRKPPDKLSIRKLSE
jgi:hypothetical protein